jgi:hypothetical protein
MKRKLLLFTIIGIFIFSCSKDEIDTPISSLKLGYHFDDFSTGYAIDLSSRLVGTNVQDQKNNGIPSNLHLVDGKFGKAISFYNDLSTFQVPGRLGSFSNQFVMDFWINISSQPTNEYRNIIRETVVGQDITRQIGIENNRISYDFENNSAITKGVQSTFQLNENEWYHIAFIDNGSKIKLFINGELNDSKTILMGTLESCNNMYFGCVDTYYDQALTFYGIIDELRVWDYDFTDDDVKNYLMTTYEF